MSFLVVANFKSHQTVTDLTSWLTHLTLPPNVLIAPSYPHLSLAISHLPHAVCAQSVSPFPPGSYTGAVNAKQLKELGVSHCLVGHSERRLYFHETSTEVSRQVHELVGVGITPIICQREADIASDRAALDEADLGTAYFCFEPSADIGGTVTAPVDHIKTITGQIKQIFSTSKVMYGGSVNPQNIASLLSLDLSGVLVSTASLNPADFNSLLSHITHA